MNTAYGRTKITISQVLDNNNTELLTHSPVIVNNWSILVSRQPENMEKHLKLKNLLKGLLLFYLDFSFENLNKKNNFEIWYKY